LSERVSAHNRGGIMADEQQRRRGGGPKTPEGKARSSQNSTRHGLRSAEIRLLPWEKQSDYDAVVAGWNEHWQPEDFQEDKLVKALIYNDWMHRRAERWLAEAEASIAEEIENPLDWTAEQERKLQLLQRYKTSAERAFYRAWSVLEGLRKDTVRRDLTLTKQQGLIASLRQENERLKGQKPEAKAQAQTAKKKQNKITTLEQWVEIEVAPSGETITKCFPPHEEMVKKYQKTSPAPDLVYRRLNFINGVPAEYYWTTSDERIRESGGMGIQRLRPEDWLKVMEEEKALGTGHLLPSFSMPRPEERGGCDCDVCTGNRRILEQEANAAA
jgi:Fe2+ or Zn2+ uptake regulation protein